jgi:hypothetical protein
MTNYLHSLKNKNLLLNKDTPLIDYLITKRHGNGLVEMHSHIAALVPSVLNHRQCFL